MWDLTSIVTGGIGGAMVALAGCWYWAISAHARGVATGAAERARLEERLVQQQRQMQDVETQIMQRLEGISNNALRKNSESFIHLARATLDKYQEGARADLSARQHSIESLTQPIRERLEKFDTKLDDLEKSRVGAYHAIDQQLNALLQTHLPQLHAETANLVKALRQPTTRGRWGEVQLRRVVELAGMLEHCDFVEQETAHAEGGRLRPDMIVRLPGGRQIVIDSKAPVDAYLTAVESRADESREKALIAHARQVRTHIDALGRKEYHEQFSPTPEFVVMFMPGEAFFSAALVQDPTLIEYGSERRVIPASPTTLIALLKAVAYGWRQEALAENAQEVSALGRDLYERIQSLTNHWKRVGKRLDQAVGAYNTSVNVLENRVLSSTRKFQTLRVAPDHKDLAKPNTIDQTVRAIAQEELVGETAAVCSGAADD